MIRFLSTQFAFTGNEISESEITTEEACRILHSLPSLERLGTMIVCETDEDKKQLLKTYYDIYHDGFNVQHQISDEEQMDLHLAYPATTDVYYVENLFFRFEAGIRALDPRFARVNSHETSFTFQMSPIMECTAIDNAPNEQTKNKMQYLQQCIIYKHEQLNHLSYEDAQKYIEQVWHAYQGFFNDSLDIPDIGKIIAVNKNYDVPWYDRL